jgi:hypothetical protein
MGSLFGLPQGSSLRSPGAETGTQPSKNDTSIICTYNYSSTSQLKMPDPQASSFVRFCSVDSGRLRIRLTP